jgi:hypothetical protein
MRSLVSSHARAAGGSASQREARSGSAIALPSACDPARSKTKSSAGFHHPRCEAVKTQMFEGVADLNLRNQLRRMAGRELTISRYYGERNPEMISRHVASSESLRPGDRAGTFSPPTDVIARAPLLAFKL